jgi:hypothetical protein
MADKSFIFFIKIKRHPDLQISILLKSSISGLNINFDDFVFFRFNILNIK